MGTLREPALLAGAGALTGTRMCHQFHLSQADGGRRYLQAFVLPDELKRLLQ